MSDSDSDNPVVVKRVAQNKDRPANRVRYVEVSAPTGWQTMDKTVREIDEAKVRGPKEDIDTLLVFAGLYSAVLSAFLVAVYVSLLPDPSTQVIYLLEEIAGKKPREPPPFVAPEWAVHVNGLWFASLIISLATASFGMLVKQWLREYLAVEGTSPQERLRTRQYRKPELDKWKVYEIAAVLPMLLQLSLGLFFIGLCIFTASVDYRMNHATIPLVCGWTFFLVFTTLSPLVSPRSPFKTPLLKSVMASGRVYVYKTVEFVVQLCGGKYVYDESQEEDHVVKGDQDDGDILISMNDIMSDDNFLPAIWEAFKHRSHDPEQSLRFVIRLLRDRLDDGSIFRSSELTSIPDLCSLSRQAWHAIMDMVAEIVRRRPPGALRLSSPDWLQNSVLLLLSNSLYPPPDSAIESLRAIFDDIGSNLEAGKTVAKRLLSGHVDLSVISRRLLLIYKVADAPHRPGLGTINRLYIEVLRSRCNLPGTYESMLHMLNQEQQLLQISSARPILEEWWNFTCSVVTPECFIPSGGQEGLIILLDFSELMDRREDAVRLFQTFWRFQDRSFMTLCRGFAALHPRSRASTISAAQIITDSFISGRLDDQATMITHSIRLMKVYAAGHLNGSGFTVLDVVRFTLFHLRLYDIHLGREVHWQPCYSPHPRRTNSPSPLADTIDWAGLWHVLVRALKEYKRAERWKKPYSSDQEYWHATTQPILTADELLAQDRELATECLRITESIEEADSGDECHLAVDRSTPHFEDEFVVALGCFILPEDVPKFPSLVKLEVKGRFSPELQKERDQGNDKEESESEKEDSDDDRKSSGRGRLRRIVTKTRRNGIEIRLPVNLGSS